MQAAAGYSASSVLHSYGTGDQFGPCAGTRPSAEANILCEQSIAGTEVPGPREGSPGSGVLSEETSPLLPEFYCTSDRHTGNPKDTSNLHRR